MTERKIQHQLLKHAIDDLINPIIKAYDNKTVMHDVLDANALKIAKEELRVQESTSRKWHKLALRFFAGATLINIILIIILILI